MAMEIFQLNISQINEEVTALSTIRSILSRFVEEIKEKADVNLKLLGDESIFNIVSSLSFFDNIIKETKEKISMNELREANESLSKITDKDVRIIYLPPMTVAAAYATGDGCEGKAGAMINQFIQNTKLLKIKPDLRSFGFDCSKKPIGIIEGSHAYEMWMSIPDDLEITEPIIKKEFSGGLYAAHVLRSWDFEDWRLLGEWVHHSEKYDSDWGLAQGATSETTFRQRFEETLNFYHFIQKDSLMEEMQLDLLYPIKEK